MRYIRFRQLQKTSSLSLILYDKKGKVKWFSQKLPQKRGIWEKSTPSTPTGVWNRSVGKSKAFLFKRILTKIRKRTKEKIFLAFS